MKAKSIFLYFKPTKTQTFFLKLTKLKYFFSSNSKKPTDLNGRGAMVVSGSDSCEKVLIIA